MKRVSIIVSIVLVWTIILISFFAVEIQHNEDKATDLRSNTGFDYVPAITGDCHTDLDNLEDIMVAHAFNDMDKIHKEYFYDLVNNVVDEGCPTDVTTVWMYYVYQPWVHGKIIAKNTVSINTDEWPEEWQHYRSTSNWDIAIWLLIVVSLLGILLIMDKSLKRPIAEKQTLLEKVVMWVVVTVAGCISLILHWWIILYMSLIIWLLLALTWILAPSIIPSLFRISWERFKAHKQ